MMRSIALVLLFCGAGAAQEVPYGVATEPWGELLGNHRARVRVEAPADAVRIHLPWRLRRFESNQRIVIFDAQGNIMRNAVRSNVNREFGDLIFQPQSGPGEYHVHYMVRPRAPGRRSVGASPEEPIADTAWAEKHKSAWQSLPEAKVLQFEARTPFDSFYPMEVVATPAEVDSLLANHRNKAYLLFPEDRNYPIRMYDDIPLRWVQRGPSDTFEGDAFRNEFYVFQIGVSAQKGVAREKAPIQVKFEDLHGPEGRVIPAASFVSFNTGGVDTRGQSFTKEWTVTPGRAAALWLGVQVPMDAVPGTYAGSLRLAPEGAAEMPVTIKIHVKRDFLRDGGVDDPSRLARLKWLNSAIGTEEMITAPYIPLKVSGASVACLGRTVRFGQSGFPESVRAGQLELLAAPITLNFHKDGKPLVWTGQSSKTLSSSPAKVVRVSAGTAGDVRLNVRTTMEFDGGIGFDVRAVTERAGELSDVVLEIPLLKERVPYYAGMGIFGGKRPKEWRWSWNQRPARWAEQGSNLEYFLWLGGVQGGLYVRIKSPRGDWEKRPDSGVEFREEANGRVVLRVRTGPKSVQAGREMQFSFRLLPTPLKPAIPDPFSVRYAHSYRPIEEVAATTANVLNIHHATLPNLWINYPFLNLDLLIPYVNQAHRSGMKLKLYYTVRELTTRLPELWALRSLGEEIYRVGGVQAHGAAQLDSWLREHLVTDYAAAWITTVPNGEIDAAIRTQRDSRWNNFYLEGLKWLLENAGIDGLYLDEIAYPRDLMQRVRKVLDKTRPGSMIDLHGNRTWWSCNSPVGYYMEHLPYVDRLWFGEEFDPNSPPDFWLVEMSGIPFGLSGDMLQDPNPWRGAVFGMTARAFYTADPAYIWKFWDQYKMKGSKMLGYWEPACPVRTGRDDVLATVYRKQGRSVIAVASWAKEAVDVGLKVDWQALGIDPAKARIYAPAIRDFQDSAEFTAGGPVRVTPGRGWLIVADERAK